MTTEKPRAVSLELLGAFLWQALGQGAGLISFGVLSTTLLPEDYGRLMFGVMVQSYVVLVGGCGLRTLMIRETARDRSQLSKWLSIHLSLTGPGGLLACVIGWWSIVTWIPMTADERLMHLWLAIGAFFSTTTVAPLMDGLGRSTLSLRLVAATELLFMSSLVSGLVPERLSALGAAFAIKWAAASLLHLIGLLIIEQIRLRWPPVSELKYLAWTASPLLLTSLITGWPIQGAVLITRCLAPADEVAPIGLAVQVAGAYLVLAGTGYRLVQTRLRQRDDLAVSENRRFILHVAGLLTVIWLLLVAAVVTLTLTLLPATYGERIFGMLLMQLAGLLGAFSYLGWACLLAVNHHRSLLNSYLFGAIVYTAVAVSVAPWWGASGVAVGSAFGQLAMLAVMRNGLQRANKPLQSSGPATTK